jgi:DNA-binding NarL/FixJ family response regulator
MTRISPSVTRSRASSATGCPRSGVTRAPLLDYPIKRVSHCAEAWLARSVRQIDPGATLLTEWSAFAAAYPGADVNVILPGEATERELTLRLRKLARQHRLPSVIVVTHLDARHLLPYRRMPVDEFVSVESMAEELPAAVLRSVIDPIREHLALYVEGLERCRPELRRALARALRHPGRSKSIQQLAAAQQITPRTLVNQWAALRGDGDQTGLADVLWISRLFAVLKLRAKGTTIDGICQRLELDLRSLQRACRRHIGASLGSVSPAAAIDELLRLRQRIVHLLRGVEYAVG